jgi:hypothetical protein
VTYTAGRITHERRSSCVARRPRGARYSLTLIFGWNWNFRNFNKRCT